ncbi:hypothetical protein FB451DRAFT_1299584 [Mycena latifolia]|nr:hypothetical protein FB451DRAFT_1299584 [Mycena latifolia]
MASPPCVNPRDLAANDMYAPGLNSRSSTPGAISIATDSDWDDSDEGTPHPSFYRRALDRENRALCRVLSGSYHIAPRVLNRRFGWSLSCISKTNRNAYIPKDRDPNKDRDYLGSDFEDILGELTKRKKRGEGGRLPRSRTEDATKLGGTTTRTQSRTSTNREFKLPVFHKVVDKPIDQKEGEGRRRTRERRLRSEKEKLEEHKQTGTPSSSTAYASRTPHAEHRTPSKDFVRDFVASVPLTPAWYHILKSTGFTEERLRQIAGIPKPDITDAFAKAFPEMPVADRIVFVEAVAGLAIPL